MVRVMVFLLLLASATLLSYGVWRGFLWYVSLDPGVRFIAEIGFFFAVATAGAVWFLWSLSGDVVRRLRKP